MLFDILNKVAQGTQLDYTSLELPKVRRESVLSWSSKIWDLTLNADLMIEPALQELSVCRLYLADPVTLRGDTRVVLVYFVSLWAFYKCIQSNVSNRCSVYKYDSVFNRISAFIVSHICMSNMSHIWMSYVSQICSVSYMDCIFTSSCIHCVWTRCEFNHFSWLIWMNMVSRFIMLVLTFFGPKFFVGAIGN